MKLLLGTNQFGNNSRNYIARESWLHHKTVNPTKLDLCCIQFDTEKPVPDVYQDFKMDAEYNLIRSSKTSIENSTKSLPFFSDILFSIYSKALVNNDITHFGYINSDCIITNNLIEYLDNNKVDALAISRIDIAPANNLLQLKKEGAQIIRNEIAGFDCFIFDKNWFKQRIEIFMTDYLIGVPVFDVITAGLIKLYGGDIYNDSSKPLVCHMIHDIISNIDTVEKEYNVNMMKANPFHHLIMNVMFYHLQYNLCKRTPWTQFLNPKEGEKEFTNNLFETLRLDTENIIKYIS